VRDYYITVLRWQTIEVRAESKDDAADRAIRETGVIQVIRDSVRPVPDWQKQ